MSVLTATACLSLIAAFRKRAACGLWTRTYARVACLAHVMRILDLLAGPGRPAETVLHSMQGSELPETHCHHLWINFCSVAHATDLTEEPHVAPTIRIIRGKVYIFQKTEEPHTRTTSQWNMQNKLTEGTALVEPNLKRTCCSTQNRTLFHSRFHHVPPDEDKWSAISD